MRMLKEIMMYKIFVQTSKEAAFATVLVIIILISSHVKL